MNESDEPVTHDGQYYDELTEESDIQASVMSPSELFKQFNEEERSAERNAAMTSDQRVSHKEHSDGPHTTNTAQVKVKHKTPEQKNPYENSKSTRHQSNSGYEKSHNSRQQPKSGYHYNEGFSSEDTGYNKHPVSYPSRTTSAYSHRPNSGVDKSTRDDRKSEAAVGNVNTVSAVVEVHHTPKTHPSVKPRAPQKRQAPTLPSRGSLHSYENIPDGQSSSQNNLNQMAKYDSNHSRTKTRRDYSQNSQLLQSNPQHPTQHQYNQQRHKIQTNGINDTTQSKDQGHFHSKNISGDIYNRRPTKDTVV